ncbi:hypothetical protein SEA_MUFASA8_66 [Arthrobacter phage Mufasa8]|uniref:Uncharacterized protein n=1 Tax=Arthrobacter phage Mufasa8 TaxID=2656526 RepID=A0A649VMV4_9CAUD|nr:hypothetical protein HYQ08_gp066 [Arthrobacter phage Mufasa8]QGJ93514.1 hypothetical protein SEA_MUFASA8_66 [Arthrobacter phage Mufasa8]
MATGTRSISINCPACPEQITVVAEPKLTSAKAPAGTAVVFIEVDRAAFDRHLATHLPDESLS